MKLWMDVMRDIESILVDHEQIFDAWEAGGVDGLVMGPMFFDAPKLLLGTRVESGRKPTATFDANPEIYRRFDVDLPSSAEQRPDQRRRLEKTMQAAKDRGWSLWIFQPGAGAGPDSGGHPFLDDQTVRALCARTIDTLQHYPMADGAILDGPEWGYEIAPHHMDHRSYIFHDLPPSAAARCAELDYDYLALAAARDGLFNTLHSLTPSQIALHTQGGLLGGQQLLGGNPDLFAWFQFREDSLTAFFQTVRTKVDAEVRQSVQLGVGPRTAAFAPLCGYNFARLAEFMDLLLPKHYFFHRGFDGLVGTVYRYVETLSDWNPGLSDGDALDVVKALFGLSLPGIQKREDLEYALTPDFFAQIVGLETRRALATVADPGRIVPWVDAGRAPHDGDPMSARDLGLLLEAAQSAGLQRFLYHHQGNLTPGEWSVMSALCGEPWRPLKSSFRPSDMIVL